MGEPFIPATSRPVLRSSSVLIPSVRVRNSTSSTVSLFGPAASPLTLLSFIASPRNTMPYLTRLPSVVRQPPRSRMFFVRPSSAIQRGGTSSIVNERISDAGAGPDFPHAHPFGLIVEPHSHSVHFTLHQTRHQ